MMYMKCNIDGRWFDIELTKGEIDEVRQKNLEDNIAIAKKLHNDLKKDLPVELINSIFNMATQHFVYRLENYANLKQRKIVEEKNKKDAEGWDQFGTTTIK